MMAFLAVPLLFGAGSPGSRVVYVGGTVAGLTSKTSARVETSQDDRLRFHTKTIALEIPYADISGIEYGLHVSRRYIEAALISPIFLAAKRRTHFLTVDYTDAQGRRQAMVLEVNKSDIRPLLVSLEARTGLRVEYQDEDARRAGKG